MGVGDSLVEVGCIGDSMWGLGDFWGFGWLLVYRGVIGGDSLDLGVIDSLVVGDDDGEVVGYWFCVSSCVYIGCWV